MNQDLMPGQDADRPPRKEPDDAYMIVGGIVGLLLGGAIGYFVSLGIGGLIIAILATAGGAILGGSVGAYLGERVKQGLVRRREEDRKG